MRLWKGKTLCYYLPASGTFSVGIRNHRGTQFRFDHVFPNRKINFKFVNFGWSGGLPTKGCGVGGVVRLNYPQPPNSHQTATHK